MDKVLKKLIYILLLFPLFSVMIYTFNVSKVFAQQTIYIKTDGSIYPPTAPIHRYSEFYNVSGDIHGSIVVERNNIIIDGQGFTLQGTSEFESKGIILEGRINVTIKNFKVKEFYYGIWLHDSHNNKIFKNEITENIGRSIWLGYSRNNIIMNNNISNNKGRGILLNYSSANITLNRIIKNGCDAIILEHSNKSLISENEIVENNGRGIWLGYSSHNIITSNNITKNNYDGISLLSSHNNTIYGNTVSRNNYCGIKLQSSSYNDIYNNNFINNVIQASLKLSLGNTWNSEYYFGGNYWSNYNGTDLFCGVFQNITGSDGLGDKPYFIDESNVDKYPLMGTFSRFNTSLNVFLSVSSNFIVKEFEYFGTNATIRLRLSNTVANQEFGFCRVTIPHILVAPKYTVMINGVSVNYTILFEDKNLTIIYFNYKDSTVEITIIPEFRSKCGVLILLMIQILLNLCLRLWRRF